MKNPTRRRRPGSGLCGGRSGLWWTCLGFGGLCNVGGQGCWPLSFLQPPPATHLCPWPWASWWGLDADWTVLAAAGGSCAGYLLFWGPEARLEPMAGIVAGLLAAALFAGTELRRRAWFLPALCGAMTAVLGLVFLLARGMVDSSGFVGFPAPRGLCGGLRRRIPPGANPAGGRWQMPAPARCWSWACARWSGSGFWIWAWCLRLFSPAWGRGRRGCPRWHCAGWRWTCPGLPLCR